MCHDLGSTYLASKKEPKRLRRAQQKEVTRRPNAKECTLPAVPRLPADFSRLNQKLLRSTVLADVSSLMFSHTAIFGSLSALPQLGKANKEMCLPQMSPPATKQGGTETRMSLLDTDKDTTKQSSFSCSRRPNDGIFHITIRVIWILHLTS